MLVGLLNLELRWSKVLLPISSSSSSGILLFSRSLTPVIEAHHRHICLQLVSLLFHIPHIHELVYLPACALKGKWLELSTPIRRHTGWAKKTAHYTLVHVFAKY